MKKIMMISAMSILLIGLAACGAQTNGAGVNASNGSNNSNGSASDSSVKTAEPAAGNTNQAADYNAISQSNVITVNSTEKVSVVPDIAEVVYSVRTSDSTADGCHRKNAEAVGQVIELLKNLGILETSIQTSDYYMDPVYNYSGNTPRLTGYEASTTLTVSDLPIDDLDNILAQSVSGGINIVRSITYLSSQYDKSYQEALTKAVSAAYEKAKVLASACGASVGKVISITETSGYSSARYTDYARSNQINSSLSAKKEALMDTAGEIMPGEIQVEAGILVEYQLMP